MKVPAGTSKGIYLVNAHSQQVLESRGVRDLIALEGRIFAGTGAGLFVSDDDGLSWSLAGLADYEVWQIRGAGDGVL